MTGFQTKVLTYIVDAAAGHPLPGGDVECRESEGKLAPLADHVSPRDIPPQGAESPDGERGFPGQSQFQGQLGLHASRRAFRGLLVAGHGGDHVGAQVPVYILLREQGQFGPNLAVCVW